MISDSAAPEKLFVLYYVWWFVISRFYFSFRFLNPFSNFLKFINEEFQIYRNSSSSNLFILYAFVSFWNIIYAVFARMNHQILAKLNLSGFFNTRISRRAYEPVFFPSLLPTGSMPSVKLLFCEHTESGRLGGIWVMTSGYAALFV